MPLGALVLMTMLEAVTLPLLVLAPCTVMKSPTLSADALDAVAAAFGPEAVLKVVADE